jgi:prepilin-type processing-associated H-X9-DG protein
MLAAILFPVFGRARENARRTSCQSNLKQLGLAFTQYLNDYDNIIPPYSYGSVYWPNELDPYVKQRMIWYCPSWHAGPLTTPSANSSTYGANYHILTSASAANPPVNISMYQRASELMLIGDSESALAGSPARNATCSSFQASYLRLSDPFAAHGLSAACYAYSQTTGFVDYRHFDGADLLFLDGHVKWRTHGDIMANVDDLWGHLSQ